MPTLPAPQLLEASPGVRVFSGTNHGAFSIRWSFGIVDFSDVVFEFQWTTHGGSSWTSGTPSGTSCLIENLSTSTNYDWRVRTTGVGYTSSPWLTGTITTGSVPANAAAIVAHTNGAAINVPTAGSALISWTPGGDKYSVTQVTFSTPGQSDIVNVTDVLTSQIIATFLIVGATYTITIKGQAQLASGTITSSNALTISGFVVAPSPAAWVGPSELFLDQGLFGGTGWVLYAPGTIVSGQSTFSAEGVGLVAPADTSISLGTQNVLVSGTPALQGIFRGQVIGFTVDIRGAITPVTKDVTVGVTGPLCIGWFNAVSTRTDLQVNQRTRAVQSFAAPGDGNAGASLRLVRGDPKKIHLFQRDAASKVVVPALSKIYFIVRAKNRRSGTPLLLQRVTSVTTESINGSAVPWFEVTAEGAVIDAIFGERNSSPAGEVASGSIECEGELVLIPTSGYTLTSRPFPVFIDQDLDR